MRDSAMYGSNKPAWHRHPNSKVVEGQPDADHAIEYAGMGWLVEKEPAECGGIVIPGFFATVRNDLPRTDPDRFLGVVQGRYQPVQNREVLGIADDLIGEGGACFETLGSLWGGKQCYTTVVLPDSLQVRDDLINKFLVIKWSHNGTSGVEGCITPVRAVCANTVRAAFASAQASVVIRHTLGAMKRIDEARRILKLTGEYYEKVGEVFNSMAAKKVDSRFVDAYLKAIFPDPREGVKPTKTNNMRNAVKELFYGGQKGADMDAVKGTAWGLYNATTEWIDWSRSTRKHGRTEDEARFDAIMWGQGAKLRQSAFGLITRQTGILRNENAETVDTVVASN